MCFLCFGFFFLKAVILAWILHLGLGEGEEAAQVPYGVLPGSHRLLPSPLAVGGIAWWLYHMSNNFLKRSLR